MSAIQQVGFQRGAAIAQRSVAAAAIGASYSLVGSIFDSPPLFLYIMSTLNGAVQISWDGVTDAIAVPDGSTVPVYIPIHLKMNGIVLPSGMGLYVKDIDNPNSGSLYVGGFTVE